MQHSLDDLIKHQEAISVMRENLKNAQCEHCESPAIIRVESLDDEDGSNIGEHWDYCEEHADPHQLEEYLKNSQLNKQLRAKP